LDRQRLPDDVWTYIFNFSINSLQEWARSQHVCRQLRLCARKPHTLAHLDVSLKSNQLDCLGATLPGVRKLELDFEAQSRKSSPKLTPKLTSVNEFRIWSATNNIMPLLMCAPRLSTLLLDNVFRLTNQGLSVLSNLKALHTLRLDGTYTFQNCTHISDLTPLAELSTLTSLSLFSIGVTDLTPLSLLPLSELVLEDNFSLLDVSPLRGIRTLRSLSLQSCFKLTTIEPLFEMTALRTLNLAHCDGIPSLDLQGLSSIPSLAVLNLSETKLTDEGLQTLCQSLVLEELCLQECDISENGVRALVSQTSLHTLDLSFCEELNDLQPLAQLTSLRELFLHGCNLEELILDCWLDDTTEECLSFLRPLTSLEKLAGFRMNDKCLLAMTHLTRLQTVDLSEHVTDTGLRWLSCLVGLQTLDLSGLDDVTDDGLAELTSLTALHTLNLRGVAITDHGLSKLSSLITLQSLDLTYCRRLTREGFSMLARLVLLQTLKVTGCTSILDQVTHLPPFIRLQTFELRGVIVEHTIWCDPGFQALHTLDVSACTRFDDASIWLMARVPSIQVCLEVLVMSKCWITPEGLGALAALTSLRELDVSHCAHVVQAHLKVLATLPLRSLNLENCAEITDRCVQELSASKTLSSVNLSDCDLLTDAGLHALQSSTLKKISILNCDRITSVGVRDFKRVDFSTDSRTVEYQRPLGTLINPDATPPVDMHASEVLRLAMLDFEPRDWHKKRYFFADPTDDGMVLLNTRPRLVTHDFNSKVKVNMLFDEVNWDFLAWRFANSRTDVHLRWYFYRDNERIIVHARPLALQ
jgi:Leucine-rich repeat (LRR) protein